MGLSVFHFLFNKGKDNTVRFRSAFFWGFSWVAFVVCSGSLSISTLSHWLITFYLFVCFFPEPLRLFLTFSQKLQFCIPGLECNQCFASCYNVFTFRHLLIEGFDRDASAISRVFLTWLDVKFFLTMKTIRPSVLCQSFPPYII